MKRYIRISKYIPRNYPKYDISYTLHVGLGGSDGIADDRWSIQEIQGDARFRHGMVVWISPPMLESDLQYFSIFGFK